MLRKIFMRNDLSKERFRNEWKYLISTSEKELLELRMKHLLKKDPNAKGNGYMIRSLYFEDYFNSAYAEKESGVLMRKKYRIRIYDCSDRSIKLERKKKFGSYIYKESAPLTKEEFYKILDGDYQFLLRSPYGGFPITISNPSLMPNIQSESNQDVDSFANGFHAESCAYIREDCLS